VLSRKIGATMAGLSTAFGILYLLGLGVNLATSGSFTPAGEDVRQISSVIALLWNLVLLALFVTLRREAQPSRAVLAELALAFAIAVCVLSCASWFSGMIAYPRLARTSSPELAALLDPRNPSSLAYALEHLGWGLFFGLATILAGLALGRPGASSWVRWALIVTGALSLAHFLGVIASSQALILLGYLSWGVALPISTAMLTRMFRIRSRRIE
jgi:hypothetical protein